MFDLSLAGDHTATAYAFSWLATFAIHSTLAVGIAALVAWRSGSLTAKDAAWKLALVLPFVTSTLQVGMHVQPLGGSWSLLEENEVMPPSGFVDAGVFSIARRGPPVGVEMSPKAQLSPRVDSWIPLPGVEPTEEVTSPVAETPSVVAEPEVVWIEPQVGSAGVPIPQSGTMPSRLELVRQSSDVQTARPLSVLGFLVVLWCAGVAIGIARLLTARVRLHHALRNRRPVHDPELLRQLETLRRQARIPGIVRLSWSRDLHAPVAFHREICLPSAALSRLSERHLAAVLAHETAHIARRDSWWLLATLVAERIFFFQPLFMIVRRRLQAIAEFICDDWAVMQSGRSLTIAESLAEVATWLSSTQRPLALPSMARDKSQLLLRVERILDGKTMFTKDLLTSKPLTRFLMAATFTILMSVTLPGVSPSVAQHVAPPPPPPAPVPYLFEPFIVEPPVWAPGLWEHVELPTDFAFGGWDHLGLWDEVEPFYSIDSLYFPDMAWDVHEFESHTQSILEAYDQAKIAASWAVQDHEAYVDQLEVASLYHDALEVVAPVWSHGVSLADGVALAGASRGATQDTVDQRVVRSLVRALGDSAAVVRKEAVDALGRLKARSAVPALVQTIGNDAEEAVRLAAVRAVANIEDDRAADGLVRALGDTSPNVRRAAAEAVGRLKVSSASPVLVRMLRDEDPAIRRTAMSQLWRLRDTSSVGAIAELVRDTSSAVRRSAISALGQFRHPTTFSALERALTDSDLQVRRDAIRALSRFRDARSVPAFRTALSDDVPEIRAVAASALGSAKDSTVVPALINALRDPDADVRRAVLNALRAYDDPRAISGYAELMSDPVPEVRLLATRAMSEMNDESAIAPLSRVIRSDSSAQVRRYALSGLARYYRPATLEALSGALSDSDQEVRYAAARGIRQLADFHDDRRAQSHASYAAMTTALPTSVPALMRAMSDDDSKVREAAAQALGYLADQRAVPTLITALSDGASDVRQEAIYALGRIEDQRALEPLIAAMEDPDRDVRRAAIRTVGRFPGR